MLSSTISDYVQYAVLYTIAWSLDVVKVVKKSLI